MFGRKKMYKKGLEDAMHAYQDFGKKQEEAIKKLREEVQSGNKKIEDMLNEIGEDINGVYDYLTDQEKATLYHLCTPKDIKELDEAERRLLVAVLYQLANDEGGWNLTDYQKKYVRSVQKYLEITNPQTEIDLSAIENIDSIDSQKVILQVVLEFMYLQDTDEISDPQEEFLGYFSLNKKQAEPIEQYVAKLYNTVGAEGICEKYGFVENVDGLLEESENSEPKVNIDIDFYYDCRIGAARRWSDDQVIFEPIEQCELTGMQWQNNILLWRGNSTGKSISHVTDLNTLKDIGTFTENVIEPYNTIMGHHTNTFSSKYVCFFDNDKNCYIIKSYDDSLVKEFRYDKYDYKKIYALINNWLVLSCWNERSDEVSVILYNFIEDTEEILEVFRKPYFVNQIYEIDEKLYIVLSFRKKLGEKMGYDIWCYDTKQHKFIWKQFRVFETTDNFSAGYSFSDQIISYDGKAEFCAYDYHENRYWRLVFDLYDGKLLSFQKMSLDEKGPYLNIQKIDHTILYTCYFYDKYKGLQISTSTFDINTNQENESEQGNEIIKRMGLK